MYIHVYILYICNPRHGSSAVYKMYFIRLYMMLCIVFKLKLSWTWNIFWRFLNKKNKNICFAVISTVYFHGDLSNLKTLLNPSILLIHFWMTFWLKQGDKIYCCYFIYNIINDKYEQLFHTKCGLCLVFCIISS